MGILQDLAKIEHGHTRPAQVEQDERFVAEPFSEGSPQSLPRWKLAEIIEARAEEIFGMVGQEIKRSGYDGLLPAGVVLCGGTALLPGMQELGRDVLGLPVRIGNPRELVGLVDRISGPDYAVGAGLVSWGLMAAERRPLPRGGSPVGRRFLNWLKALLPG